MEQRMDYYKMEPALLKGMLGFERAVATSGLEHSLLELVKFRASQLNGCAYCLDMHSKDARKAGETEQRLYGLSAWREAPYYTARERAALAWTEKLTTVSQAHPTDAEYEELTAHFKENEILQLTYGIMAINAWNRLAIAMKATPGGYVAGAKPSANP
jgi:AhpD family alkylhydroperoxidase